MMVLQSGAELVTGNMCMLSAARFEGRVSNAHVLCNWGTAYVGNLVGALVVVTLAVLSETVTTPYAVQVAVAKTTKTFIAAFSAGVLCNYLVCMAVYMASGCSDLASKMVAIWFPISAFVALGFEHCVANMFMIPLGMARGADVTVGAMVWRNLVPVTIGNVVGAVLFVTMPFWAAFGVDGAAAKECRDREMTGKPENVHLTFRSHEAGGGGWAEDDDEDSPETSKFN